MALNINKRQQVRNERALQDLIKTVPGNDRCADCNARNPGWASWSLGIFLCITCGALHRKLGTHISKVKSLTMDSWSSDQVENMKRIGNVTSNAIFNPRNTKPAIPIDADEVEGVMERFIRQKYEHRIFASDSAPGSRQNTGSTSSDDRPPPLPPKPSKRFHFPSLRSASSTLPVSRSNTLSPPVSPGLSGFGHEPSPPPKDKKPAKFLGAEVGGSRDDGFETKLAYLRDMGFPDEKRNQQVLRGLDGNVERSVETLVRLGEGTKSKNSSRSHSPLPPGPLTAFEPPTNGLSMDKAVTTPTGTKSNNPFDVNVHKSLPPPPQQGQTLQRGLFMERTVSPTISSNPFLQPGQQQLSLDQSFQNLQISQQQQQQQQQTIQDQFIQTLQNPQTSQQFHAATPQLFPNTTGGNSITQPQTNPFLQTYTAPPVPYIPTQYQQFTEPSPFPLPQQNSFQPQPTGQAPNPFLRTSKSQTFSSSNAFQHQPQYGSNAHQYPSNNVMQQPQQPVNMAAPELQSHYNPFQSGQASQQHAQQNPPSQLQFQRNLTSSPFQQTQSSSYFQQTQTSPFQSMASSQQQQQVMYDEPQSIQQTAPASLQSFASPASAPPQQQHLFQPPPFNPSVQQQHQATYPPVRQDKSSILALYNYPQATPTPTSLNGIQGNGQLEVPPTISSQRRSVTMPVGQLHAAGSTNPFSLAPNGTLNSNAGLGGGGTVNGSNRISMMSGISPAQANGFRHVSNESVDFGGNMMMNGRHSPDAFSGLSARLR